MQKYNFWPLKFRVVFILVLQISKFSSFMFDSFSCWPFKFPNFHFGLDDSSSSLLWPFMFQNFHFHEMLKWRVKINVKSQTENQVKWAKMKTTPNFKGKKCILVNTNFEHPHISNYLYALGSKLVQTISIMTTFRLCFLCELHQQALTSCIPKLQEIGEKNKVSYFKKTHITYTTDGKGSFQAIQ